MLYLQESLFLRVKEESSFGRESGTPSTKDPSPTAEDSNGLEMVKRSKSIDSYAAASKTAIWVVRT